jgi:peptidoglycan/LPS O-acetylase OafA/YrhL
MPCLLMSKPFLSTQVDDMPILALPVQDALSRFLLTFAITFLLACPISWLIWAAVEEPFQRLGRRLIGWLEEPSLPNLASGSTDLS